MILNSLSLIERAAKLTAKADYPDSSKVVEALFELEKLNKKANLNYSLNDLIGIWNLRFITGTRKSRKRMGIALGSGRYIPQLLNIQIDYELDPQRKANMGRVKNTVRLGFITFSLSGPVKFIEPKNILAFDFTKMLIKIFGQVIYDGYIKDGASREQEFEQKKINQQAFFSYFLIEDKFIAARGRGGGLALWSKE